MKMDLGRQAAMSFLTTFVGIVSERPLWVEGEKEEEKMVGREGWMPLCLSITYWRGDRVSGKSSPYSLLSQAPEGKQNRRNYHLALQRA